MANSHPTSGGILQVSQTILHTGIWAGKFMQRQISSAWTGVCPVCNNLQPFNHEDTIGNTPRSAGRWTRFEGRQAMTDLVKEAALYIPGIKTKTLLEVRDIDAKTGKPTRDCRYCRLLCDALDLFFIDEWMSWITDTKNGMHLDVGLNIRQGSPLIINCSGCFVHDPKVMHPRADLEMFCPKEENLETPGAPVLGMTVPRNMDTRDPSCMEFARTCMSQCLNEHSLCKRKTANFVPTRLIAIGRGEEDIKLCDTPPVDAKWAALSHCWGGIKPLRLLSTNMSDLKQQIDVSALPETFRDAIQVCRNLSIQWVWIDSLCIIQDNPRDWQEQAAQMGTVYQEAFLVIIAGSSSKPSEAFLGRREEDWDTKILDFETSSGAKMPIAVRKRHLLAAPLDYGEYDPPFTETWATLKRVGPLYKRSWCFQEAFLASRALHFAPGAVIFECKTHRRSDDSEKTYSLAPPPSMGPVSDERKWRMIVKSYTCRDLTFASDKLPAASGIASLMPQAANDKYMAGLWRKSLLEDLIWQVMPCSGRTSMTMTFPPTEQAAPTWSWASLNQGVLWNDFHAFDTLVTIEEASCTVDGVNPYGTVSQGHIKLKGRLTACVVKQTHQHHAFYNKSGGKKSAEHWFMGDGRLVSTTHAVVNPTTPLMRRYNTDIDRDRIANDSSKGGAFVLCIAKTGIAHYNYVGLVLTLSEKHPGCMERIGNITNLPKSWHDDGKEMSITLV